MKNVAISYKDVLLRNGFTEHTVLPNKNDVLSR